MIGHRNVAAQLGDSLPPVALFVGPDSVGKNTLTLELEERDGLEAYRYESLSVPLADQIVRNAQTAPRLTEKKLIVVNLDGSRADAQNVLLLALEAAIPSTHFIFLASYDPLDTIMTRCEVFRFGLLSEDEVAEILVSLGTNEQKAQSMAAVSGGQMKTAFASLHLADDKIPVLVVLKALNERNPDMLEAVANRWTDKHTYLLNRWAREAVTGRWRVFDKSENPIEGQAMPLKILMATRADVRPKLLVRANLMGLVKG